MRPDEPKRESRCASRQPQHRHRSGRTFEEAVLAVDHVDAPPLQAGGAVHLAVVLVEAAVGATHGHERGPAPLLADALGTPGFRHHGALPAPPTVSPPAGTFLQVGQSWKDGKDILRHRRYHSVIFTQQEPPQPGSITLIAKVVC